MTPRTTTTRAGKEAAGKKAADHKVKAKAAATVVKSTKTGTGASNGSARSARATPPASRQWHPELRAQFVTEIAGGTRKAADLLAVAPSQPSRWVSGASVPGPVQARILVDIDHVLAHALLVWADVRVARDWLTTPNAHLDGVRPVEWIRMHGTSEVVEALRAEAAGAFA